MAAKQESSLSAHAVAHASGGGGGVPATTPPRAVASISAHHTQRTPSPAKTAPIIAAATTTTSSTTTGGQAVVVDELKHQLAKVTQLLQTKEEEANALQEKLAALEKESADQRLKLQAQQSLLAEAEEAVAKTKQDEDSMHAAAAAMQPTPTKAILQKSVETAHEQNFQLQSTVNEWKDRLEAAERELAIAQSQLASQEQQQKAQQQELELTRARAAATSHQNQLQAAAADQTEQRGTSDAAHYKERAKLQADVSALKRKVEQLQQGHMELEATIEDVTLDKEQLLEENNYPARELEVHAFGTNEVEIEATLMATSVEGEVLDQITLRLTGEPCISQAFWSPSTSE